MARINPFRAVRPSKELSSKVASFPYDVLNSEEAAELTKENEYSFLHIVKPEIDLPRDTDIYDKSVYEKGKENLYGFIEKGYLTQEDEPKLYVYKQKMGDHEQAGIVASCHIDDYLNNIIKKHEHTRKDKEEDRKNHVRYTNANTGPVFLTYTAKDSLDSIINEIMKGKPEVDFTSSDSITHTVWVINEKSIMDKLVKEFADVDYLYVADGHHRSASAAIVGQELRGENSDEKAEHNWFLSVIFPHNQLKILDYNRIVKDICGLTPEEFLASVSKKFNVKEVGKSQVKPDGSKKFGMYLGSVWYELEAKDTSYDKNDAVSSLDVSILQENLLHPILRIDDPRVDKRINFVGGIRGLSELEKLVDSGQYKVAFSMHPTSIEELMKIADQDKVMPPKSTWFEPKLRSGLFVHLLK